jgi:hypothetical protein
MGQLGAKSLNRAGHGGARNLGEGGDLHRVDSTTGDLDGDLVPAIYGASRALPLNFMVDWSDGFWVVTNFTDTDQTTREYSQAGGCEKILKHHSLTFVARKQLLVAKELTEPRV